MKKFEEEKKRKQQEEDEKKRKEAEDAQKQLLEKQRLAKEKVCAYVWELLSYICINIYVYSVVIFCERVCKSSH